MSHNIRSSRSSPRFSPYPASHTPAAVRLSPLSPSSGQYAARTSSENYLSPAPAYYQSLTPYPFVPPIQNHQPIPAAQLFTTCQHWMDQDYSVSQRPTRQDHGALPSYSVGQQPLKLPQEESSLQGATVSFPFRPLNLVIQSPPFTVLRRRHVQRCVPIFYKQRYFYRSRLQRL